jgi:hypothetical protein
MRDMKNAVIVYTHGDGGRVLCARPGEIDACQYHGLNYMAAARLRHRFGDFQIYGHRGGNRWMT